MKTERKARDREINWACCCKGPTFLSEGSIYIYIHLYKININTYIFNGFSYRWIQEVYTGSEGKDMSLNLFVFRVKHEEPDAESVSAP